MNKSLIPIVISVLVLVVLAMVFLPGLPISNKYWKRRAQNICRAVDRGAVAYYDIRHDKLGTQLVHFKCENGTNYYWRESERNFFIEGHEKDE